MTMYLIDAYAFLVTLLIFVSLVYALPRYFFAAFHFRPRNERVRSCFPSTITRNSDVKTPCLRVLLYVLVLFLSSRLLTWCIGWAGSYFTGELDAFWGRQGYLFYQWDASHYLGIAENWYVTEGDARLHLVFYPLYPLIVRLFAPVFGGDSLISAVTVSNVCLLASGYVLYRTIELTYSFKTALWSLIFFMFCPAGMFFSIAYTESLFFLLTISSVYCARKRRFFPAILLGSLSAFTRLPGVICAVPIFFEMLRYHTSKRKKPHWHVYVFDFLKCALVLSGFCAYLLVNYSVSGDPFRFLVYQKMNWGQEAGNILSTARYTLFYAIYPNVDWYQWGIWIPQTAALILTASTIFFSKRRLHPGDLAYSIVYFVVTISPTMLLSGPRYLCALYAVYPALGIFCEKRWARPIVIILFAAMYVYCAWMFMGKTILL